MVDVALHASLMRQVSSSGPYPRVLTHRKSESLADGLAPPHTFFCPSMDFTHLFTPPSGLSDHKPNFHLILDEPRSLSVLSLDECVEERTCKCES